VTQEVLIDNTYFENLSQTVKSGFYQIEETQQISVITGPPTEENESIVLKILKLLSHILQRFLNAAKETYYNFKEILPKIFDKIIESVLEYTHSKKRQLGINFMQIYEMFELLGLEEISIDSFNKISACVQWKIISPDWIKLDFLKDYREGLLSNASDDILEAINTLEEVILMRIREEKEEKLFESELLKLLQE
jgi:hypothetical protein